MIDSHTPPLTVIFYGKSGSGKGTQARLLEQYLSQQGRTIDIYETGKILREFIGRESGYVADKVEQVMDTGALLPEFIPIWAWTQAFITNLEGTEDIILDGLARRLDEAPVLMHALSFLGRTRTCIISLDVSDAWSTQRMVERGREDDTAEAIERRLAWYQESIPPILEFYTQAQFGTVLHINGEQPIADVHNDIIAQLSQHVS